MDGKQDGVGIDTDDFLLDLSNHQSSSSSISFLRWNCKDGSQIEYTITERSVETDKPQ